MLSIILPEKEYFNEDNNEFVMIKPVELKLEHSLISVSKWESKWHKPFLDNKDISVEEFLDYIRCMSLCGEIDIFTMNRMTQEDLQTISNYIKDPMSATTFGVDNSPMGKKEIVTSELIYYWMSALQIPFTCEKWHLNRLLNLIRIGSIKNAPPKKMSKSETMRHHAKVNAARRAKKG